jgi:hypothetical protein
MIFYRLGTAIAQQPTGAIPNSKYFADSSLIIVGEAFRNENRCYWG